MILEIVHHHTLLSQVLRNQLESKQEEWTSEVTLIGNLQANAGIVYISWLMQVETHRRKRVRAKQETQKLAVSLSYLLDKAVSLLLLTGCLPKAGSRTACNNAS